MCQLPYTLTVWRVVVAVARERYGDFRGSSDLGFAREGLTNGSLFLWVETRLKPEQASRPETLDYEAGEE